MLDSTYPNHSDFDYVLDNAVVLAGDEASSRARSVGVRGGRIVAVSAEPLTGPHTIDLDGRTIVPGFHDAHCHTAWYGTSLTGIPLQDTATVDEVLSRVAERAALTPVGEWVIGSGLNPMRNVGRLPTLRDLDRLAPDHPVWLIASSGHASVINSRVLDFLDRGELERFAPLETDEDGTLTGFLEEQAHACVLKQAQPYNVDDVATAIEAAHRNYVAEGITAVQEAGIGAGLVGYGESEAAAYQQARDRGDVFVRTTLMPSFLALHDVRRGGGQASAMGLDLGLRSGFGDEWLRLGPVKFFTDGSILAGTSELHSGYPENGGRPKERLYDRGDVRQRIIGAHAAGWQVAVHAQGDAAIDFVLDCLEEAQCAVPRPDTRHRIEHCSVTSDAAIERIESLGVVPSPQGRFVGVVGEGLLELLDDDQLRRTYRMRSYIDRGITVAGSSDRPCTTGEPLRGIHDLVNRRTDAGTEFGADEAVSVDQALRSYSHGSAYASHMDSWVGTVEAGKVADFAILGDDPTAISPERIKDIEVTATIVGGRFVHDTTGEFA